MEYKISDFRAGQRFRAKINGILCEGKVQIQNGNIYLCQDVIDGSGCDNKLGFKYSWVITEEFSEPKKLIIYLTTDLVLFNDHILTPSARLEIKTDGKEAKMVDCRIDGVQGFQINQPTQYGIAIDDLFSIKTYPTYEVKLYGKVITSDELRDFFKQHDPRIAELRKELAELEAKAENIRNTLKERN